MAFAYKHSSNLTNYAFLDLLQLVSGTERSLCAIANKCFVCIPLVATNYGLRIVSSQSSQFPSSPYLIII